MNPTNTPDFDESCPLNVNPARYQYHGGYHEEECLPPAQMPQRHGSNRFFQTNTNRHPYSDGPRSSDQHYSSWYRYSRHTFHPPPHTYTPRGYEQPDRQEPVYSEEPLSPPSRGAPYGYRQAPSPPSQGAYGYRQGAWIPGPGAPTRSNGQRNYEPGAFPHHSDWEHPNEPSALSETFIRTEIPNSHPEPQSRSICPPLSTRGNPEANSDYPGAISYIWDVRPNDIMCGRGANTQTNPGNIAFRELIRQSQVEYLACRRNEKPVIATKITDTIRSGGGRFLLRVKVSDQGSREGWWAWREIGDKRVYEKVCQALRDGAPRIRQHMLAMSKTSESHDKENSINRTSMVEAVDNRNVRRAFSTTYPGADVVER